MTGRPGGPAGRDHGTEARYQSGPDENDMPGRGCHCRDCRQARRDAANHRTRMRAYGWWQPFTDAGPARAWVRMLMEHPRYPIGWQRVAALAGVSVPMVEGLLYEVAGKPRARQIRPVNDARIRAVEPVLANVADLALIDATGTRRRLQALVARGWPPLALCARPCWHGPFFHAVLRRQRVTARTAKDVLALYSELWDIDPPQRSRAEQTAARRAVNLAARHGWAVPQAWDDEEIDDPQAAPADWRRSAHRPPALILEEALELIGEQGYDRAGAAARLGVARDYLDTIFCRAARAAAAAGGPPPAAPEAA